MTEKGASTPQPFVKLEQSQLHEARALAARLSHHLGKYVSRMARNLPEGKVPETIKVLLIKDLYALHDNRSALSVFDTLAMPLNTIIGEAHLKECRTLLAEINHLESNVRQGEDGAVRRAAALAIRVDEMLKALAKTLTEACHDQ